MYGNIIVHEKYWKWTREKTAVYWYMYSRRFGESGGKEAFAHLKAIYPKVCLVHLYALQGAIDEVEYNQLSEELKAELKEYSDGLK